MATTFVKEALWSWPLELSGYWQSALCVRTGGICMIKVTTLALISGGSFLTARGVPTCCSRVTFTRKTRQIFQTTILMLVGIELTRSGSDLTGSDLTGSAATSWSVHPNDSYYLKGASRTFGACSRTIPWTSKGSQPISTEDSTPYSFPMPWFSTCHVTAILRMCNYRLSRWV